MRRKYNLHDVFIKSGLVDTMYLTTEPIIFGAGMGIFKEDLDIKLELVNLDKTEAGTIFSEYKIINN